MIELDEDLIAGYKCIKCGANVCKDEVFRKIDGLKCICLECGFKGGKKDDNQNRSNRKP